MFTRINVHECSRYDTLYITGKDVTVRWSDTGEFKFSGTYGKWQPSKEDY